MIFQQTLKRSSAILFLSAFLSIIGISLFLHMPRSLFPEIDYPRVVVEINMGFAPLQNMEWGVTSVLEREVRAVPGVRLVKSSTSRGTSSLDIFLREGEDVTQAVQRVNAKIAEVRSMLSPAAQITVRPITASAFASAEYCFVSKSKNTRDLRTLIEYTLKPLILVQPGIFNTRVIGGDLPEYSIQLDPRKLALRNLTVSEIGDRLKNSNGVDFLGPINQDGAEILAFGGRYLKTASDIENVVVDTSLGRSVRISDIGAVQLTNAWKYKQLSLNGSECVVLDVFYQSGIDQKKTSLAVAKTVNEFVSKEKNDISFRHWDLNDFTDTATNAVLVDLLVGMLIIGLITYFFLRNLQYSFFALLVMPLAASLTFLLMSLLHLTINLMTLGGLTAAIGLVVDNTVIILEMFHHRRAASSASDREILIEVLASVTKPMIFGTATIILVFVPIGLLSGVSGMFFMPMALVNAISLTISVFVALLTIPALVLLFHRHERRQDVKEPSLSSNRYDNLINLIISKPKWVGLCLFIVPLVGLLSINFAKTGFLPEWDEGDIVIDYRSSTPLALAATIEKLKPLEDYLKTVPEIDFFIRKTGTSLGELTKSSYVGEIVMKLKQKRSKDVFQLREELGSQAGKLVPGFEFDLFQILPDRLNDLSGSGKPVVIYLRGGNEDQLDLAAEKIKSAFTKIRGLDSVRIEEPEKAPEILFNIDESLSRILEMNPTAVNENARFALFSIDTSEVQLGPQTIPIRLKMIQEGTKSDIAKTPLYTTKGGLEQLGKIGKIQNVKNRVKANHIDGNPVRTITAEIAGRDLGSVISDVQKALETNQTEGVFPDLAGEYRNQQSSFKELLLAFAVGLAFIFLTSLFFSNQIRLASILTLCSLIPPSVGLAGCVLFGIPLDVSSFTGLISVTGIAVANCFMAISAIESEKLRGVSWQKAIALGMQSRLRPILMTNTAAMAGFVPIAIGLASGDEILRPFSIAVIIGLFGALYATLIIMPALYAHFVTSD